MARTSHPWGSICETPIGFAPLPMTDLSSVYAVAASMVGMERKNENSNAAARNLTACNCCHRARGSGKYCRKDLAEANPHRLPHRHVFHLPGVNAACGCPGTGGFPSRVQRIHDPHHNRADQQ